MNLFVLLDAGEQYINKSAEMLDKDPHGFIITAVSVMVVFSALIILYFAYKLAGKVVSHDWSSRSKKPQKVSKKVNDEDTAAAIAMALHEHFTKNTHDTESYTITIKRK